MEGQSSYGAELPGSDTCSYSYNSEISDSWTRSSEGSFDSASKFVTFDCVKQEPSVQIGSPNLYGSLIDRTSKPLCDRQDIQFEIPSHPGISNFAAGATDHVSDIGGTLHTNYSKGETGFEFSSLEANKHYLLTRFKSWICCFASTLFYL